MCFGIGCLGFGGFRYAGFFLGGLFVVFTAVVGDIETTTLENEAGARADQAFDGPACPALLLAMRLRAFCQSGVPHGLKDFKSFTTFRAFVFVSWHRVLFIIRRESRESSGATESATIFEKSLDGGESRDFIDWVMLPWVFFAGAIAGFSFARENSAKIHVAPILEDLENLEKRREKIIQNAKRPALDKVKSGLRSGAAAVDLFEEATKAVAFEGARDKTSSFLEWKKSNSEELRSSRFQAALRLHLSYLILSLEREEQKRGEEFAERSLDFARQVMAFLEALETGRQPVRMAGEVLGRPVSDSVFARWLGLVPWLPKSEDWELTPGNYAGILEKNVRSVYRKQKNPQIGKVWDMQIEFEKRRVANERLVHREAQFREVQLPRMRFARANDLALVGKKTEAVAAMMELVRGHMTHPDFPQWVQQIRSLLAEEAKIDDLKIEEETKMSSDES